ncbi:MAG: hypothetical protein ABJZ55_19935 [Fuerstiella sp.]
MGQLAAAEATPNRETLIMIEYPSIAAIPLGLWLGRLYESSSRRLLGRGPKLSQLLALPTAPIGVLLYAWQKLLGDRYVLTNKTLTIQTAITRRSKQSVPLDEVNLIQSHSEPGHQFFTAADLKVLDNENRETMVLAGVKEPDAFRNAIQQAVAAKAQVAIAAARIQLRTTQTTT